MILPRLYPLLSVICVLPLQQASALDFDAAVLTQEVYNRPCLVKFVDELLTAGLKAQVEKASPKYGMFSSSISPVVCTQHQPAGQPVVAPAAPKLIAGYWADRARKQLPTSCPPPFSGANLYAVSASFGCRAVQQNGTNICATKAYIDDNTIASIQSSNDPLSDQNYVNYSKFYVVNHLDEFPSAKKCVQSFYKLGPKQN